MSESPSEPGAALAAERLLVERCLAGDADARRQLVLRFHAAVRQSVDFAAARWGGGVNPADVDDATQQAFFSFFMQDMLVLRRWRGDARLKTYLNRVAERIAAKHFRAVSGHGRRFLLFSGGADDSGEGGGEAPLDAIVADAQRHGLLDEAASLPQRLEQAETQAELRAALLARLSEKGRDYYRHLFVDELDMAEICRREQTNPNNVYQWKNRILREAAALLAPSEPGAAKGEPGPDEFS